MKTIIRELGVIDNDHQIHRVKFNAGLNIVTGKSSTGKSALIEIFDYCFGSSDYTVPKGVITNNANIYYLYLQVGDKNVVVGRSHLNQTKGFFKLEDNYEPELININYFIDSNFMALDRYRKQLRRLFMNIDDVDTSFFAPINKGRKSPTPSIRSFVSFILQHQNLIANKHAMFYRFDEKEKREQAIEHTKIFLNIVDQEYYLLSQESERIQDQIKKYERQKNANENLREHHKNRIVPVLSQLYAQMGFSEKPVSLNDILDNPSQSLETLDELIQPQRIDFLSDAESKLHISLKTKLSELTISLRRLQQEELSISKHIKDRENFIENLNDFENTEVNVAHSICPFCTQQSSGLEENAEILSNAILKISRNIGDKNSKEAIFESSLVKVRREIEETSKEVSIVANKVRSIEKSNEQLKRRDNLYNSILKTKSTLELLVNSLDVSADKETDDTLKELNEKLKGVKRDLNKYDFSKKINQANEIVNSYMRDIGSKFEFEESYQPINLKFSFSTFDLYHLTPENNKIYLRSMGSGANWLYSHISLFLALHKYFVSLGNKCAIPSVLFLDQPTQVYFPSFKLDKSEKFDKEELSNKENRDSSERRVDEDLKAVENLFSQLSIYCTEIKGEYGFSPQIIVTDHADDLELEGESKFEKLVNSNRWRERGLIYPVNKPVSENN